MYFPVLLGILCLPLVCSQWSCEEDSQCHNGFYCEIASHICMKCLSCVDFRRQTGPVTDCVKSVGDCGPCLEGLVVDHRGDLQCVPPTAADEGMAGLPSYMWAIIAAALLILLILIIVAYVFLFRGHILKISTRTLLHPSCPAELGNAAGAAVGASAPDPPPPYNPSTYLPLRPDSPPAADNYRLHYMDRLQPDDEVSPSFVKRAPSDRRGATRESEDSQRARVFNTPNYVRRSPHSPEDFKDEDLSPVHDEDTTESTWTPNADSSTVNNNASVSESGGGGGGAVIAEASSLPALLAAARDTALLEPPNKKPKPHDSNNNGNNDSESSTSTTHVPNAPAMYLNIQVNNTLGTAYTGQLNTRLS